MSHHHFIQDKSFQSLELYSGNIIFKNELSIFKSPSNHTIPSTRRDYSNQEYFEGYSNGHEISNILHDDLNKSPPFCCAWSEKDDRLFAFGNEQGRVSLLKCHPTESHGNVQKVKSWEAHQNAIFDLIWSLDGSQICTASADCSIKRWDVATGVLVDHMHHHQASVKSISFNPVHPNLLLSGSRDNCIFIWDTRYKCSTDMRIINLHDTIPNAHGEQVKPSARRRHSYLATVTSAIYLRDGYTIASAGASDQAIKYWDLRNCKKSIPAASCIPLDAGKRAFGYSCLKLNPDGSKLYAACSNDHVYEFDSNRLTQTNAFTTPTFTTSSFYIKIDISPCGNFLASGSQNSDVFVWQVQNPQNHLLLKGHRAEVTGIAWSKQESKLVSCSDDMSVRLWSPLRDDQLDNHDPGMGFAEIVCPTPPVELEPPSIENAEIQIDGPFITDENQQSTPGPSTTSSNVQPLQSSSSSKSQGRKRPAKTSSTQKPKRSSLITQFFKPLQSNYTSNKQQ